MLNAKTFLSLDYGAGTLKMAEFEVTEAGGLRLNQFGFKSLGLLGSQDTAREGLLKKAFADLASSTPVSAKLANVCAPTYQVFNKFIKLPPVDSSKAAQIIQYEAQQNIPFPLPEVVWDYQKVGVSADNSMEVLLVAIKSDLVESLFRSTLDAGRNLQLVDISIAAKTSNALFFEKGRFFARSLNVGANAITQEFAAEAKMPFAQAEQFKISEGFVSLGGAYEDPDNQRQAQVSKIARNVLTRLHIQINQTIQFYQKQNQGSAPSRIYLSGGGATLPYTAEFFKEKFGVEVEYFNPLQSLEIAPEVDLEKLQSVGHCMGELVGMALRNLAECPLELNLVPVRVRESQKLEQKKPFFIASVAALVIGLFGLGWYYGNKTVSPKREIIGEIQQKVAVLQGPSGQLSTEKSKISDIQTQLNEMTQWAEERFLWTDILNQLYMAAVETENEVAQLLSASEGKDIKAGLWIDQMIPDLPDMEVGLEDASSRASGVSASTAAADRRRLMMMNRGRGRMSSRYAGLLAQAESAAGAQEEQVNTNEVREIKLTCKAVNLKQIRPTANDELAFKFEKRIKGMTNLFNPQETGLTSQSAMTNAYANTFTFDIKLKLKKPIKI